MVAHPVQEAPLLPSRARHNPPSTPRPMDSALHLHLLSQSQVRALLAIRRAGTPKQVVMEVAAAASRSPGAGGCVYLAALGQLELLHLQSEHQQQRAARWQRQSTCAARREQPKGGRQQQACLLGVHRGQSPSHSAVPQPANEAGTALAAILQQVLAVLPRASPSLLASVACTSQVLGLSIPWDQQQLITAAFMELLKGPSQRCTCGHTLASFAWATFGLWELPAEERAALLVGIASRCDELVERDVDLLREALLRLWPGAQTVTGAFRAVLQLPAQATGGSGGGSALGSAELEGAEASLLACEGTLPLEEPLLEQLLQRLQEREQHGKLAEQRERSVQSRAGARAPTLTSYRQSEGTHLGCGSGESAEVQNVMYYI